MKKLLTEVCDIQYGFPFDASLFNNSEGVPLIRIRDVKRGYSETYTTEQYDEEYIVKKGDILIGMDGEFNVAKWGEIPAVLNQRVCRVFPHDDVDANYIYYSLPRELKKIEARTSFATVKHLSAKEINKIQIPVPLLDEQKIIANKIAIVEEVISKRKQQLEQLDLLIKARFAEMFGMPGTDTKGWGLNSLGSVCHINPKKSQDYRLGSGVMVSFVPMPAVTETGEIDLSSTNVYDEVKTGFTYFAEGDVLFAKITPCMENGKGAVAKGLCNGIGFGSTEFHVLRPINGRTNPYWLYTLTAFPQFRTDAAGNMTGSAGQRRVPATFLENYRVSVPPIELQQQFADFVAQVDKSKVAVQKSLDEVQLLFDSLMQEYFG
jgi:type I restriction enzyme S subunit